MFHALHYAIRVDKKKKKRKEKPSQGILQSLSKVDKEEVKRREKTKNQVDATRTSLVVAAATLGSSKQRLWAAGKLLRYSILSKCLAFCIIQWGWFKYFKNKYELNIIK